MNKIFNVMLLSSLLGLNFYVSAENDTNLTNLDSEAADSCDLISDKELEELIKLLTCDAEKQADQSAEAEDAEELADEGSAVVTEGVAMESDQASAPESVVETETNIVESAPIVADMPNGATEPNVIDETVNTVASGVDEVTNATADVANAATNTIANAADTAVDVAKNVANTATDVAAGTVNTVSNAVKSILG